MHYYFTYYYTYTYLLYKKGASANIYFINENKHVKNNIRRKTLRSMNCKRNNNEKYTKWKSLIGRGTFWFILYVATIAWPRGHNTMSRVSNKCIELSADNKKKMFILRSFEFKKFKYFHIDHWSRLYAYYSGFRIL